MSKFKYPVSDPFEARAVTEPTFEENIFTSNLYVNLDDIRGKEYLTAIKFDLGIGDRWVFPFERRICKTYFLGTYWFW